MSLIRSEEGWKWTNIVGCLILVLLFLGSVILAYNYEPKEVVVPQPIEKSVVNNYYKDISLPYTKYEITMENGTNVVFDCPENKCQ